MNIDDLRRNLAIQSDGTVTITAATVTTAKYAGFYTGVLFNTPVRIIDAATGPDNGGDTVQIIGHAAMFRNVADIPICATFVLDPATGDVTVALRFELIGDGRSWKFSDSYPDLPVTFDFTTALDAPQTSPLDDLPFDAGWFYALTDDTAITVDLGGRTDSVALKAGLGFAGIVQLHGILLAIETLISPATRYAIGGNIVPEAVNALPLRDAVNNFPWKEMAAPPGITLAANLHFDIDLSDKLTFGKTSFSVYSPLTTAWYMANPSYEPFMAFGGELDIPSANLQIALSSKVLKGVSQLVITEEFAGFTLDSLADLTDLAGTSALSSLLPPEIEDKLHEIGRLQLIDAAVSLSCTATGIGIDYVYLTVGIPKAGWSVLDGTFALDSIAAEFHVSAPLTKPQAAASVHAVLDIKGTHVGVTAGYPDFFLVGELEDGVTLPLHDLIATYCPEIEPPSDLTIDKLALNIQPSVGYNFYVEMAKAPGWRIPLGPNSLAIEDVSFGIFRSAGPNPTTSGQIAGGLVFDDALTLAMAYDPTQGFTMRADFPTVTLNGLIAWICNADNVLPAGLGNLEFTDSTLMITKSGGDFQLSFGTQIATAGSFAFVLQDHNGKWGFVIGLDLLLGQLSQLPGLEPIGEFLKIWPINGEQIVIVSTLDQATFEFPALSKFDNPKITSQSIALPSWSQGLRKGFYFYAQTSLSGNTILENLAALLDISPTTSLDCGIFVGSNAGTEAELFAGITTRIANAVDLTGTVGIRWKGDIIEFYMAANAVVEIQNQQVRFDIVLDVVENGAFIAGDMIVVGGRNTLDFGTFKLQHLALEAGISFEGIPSLGFSAALDIADIDSAVAIFIDTALPERSMVAGSVSDITLAKIFDEISGATAPMPSFLRPALSSIGLGCLHSFTGDWATYHNALNNYDLAKVQEMFTKGKVGLPGDSSQIQLIVNTPDSLWYLLDLSTMYHYQLVRNGHGIDVSLEAQIYVVPEAVTIASVPYQQGFHVFGKIDFLIIHDRIAIEILPTKGVAIDIELSSIVIGNADLFSLTGAHRQGGPRLLLCTFSDPNNANPNWRQPAFKASGELYLLGINPIVDIDINAEHCHFELHDTVLGGSNFTLKVDIGGLTSFSGSGSASVGISTSIDFGALGTLSIDDTIYASIGFGTSTHGIYADADFSFTLAKDQHDIARFALDVDTGPLGDLAGIIIQKIKEFFVDQFKAVKKWLEYVYKGILHGLEGMNEIGEVLKKIFNLAYKEAAALMQSIGYTAEQVEQMLIEAFNLTLDEARNVADFLYNTIKNCAMTTANLAAPQTINLLPPLAA